MKNANGFRRLLSIALCIVSLTGCDKVAQRVSGDNLPPEIKQSVADVGAVGNLYLDFPYLSGCSNTPNDATGYVGVYFKNEHDAFPTMQGNGLIETEHLSSVRFMPDMEKWLVNTLLADAVQTGLVVRANSVNPTWNTTLYCYQLNELKIGALYANYKKSDGSEARGLILAADFTYDGADMLSEFDRARPWQGYVAKHRKYHLLAHLTERSALGSRVQKLQRDLVIYFDPENKVWVVDPSDGSGWYGGPS